jgi:hypothetical protein
MRLGIKGKAGEGRRRKEEEGGGRRRKEEEGGGRRRKEKEGGGRRRKEEEGGEKNTQKFVNIDKAFTTDDPLDRNSSRNRILPLGHGVGGKFFLQKSQESNFELVPRRKFRVPAFGGKCGVTSVAVGGKITFSEASSGTDTG